MDQGDAIQRQFGAAAERYTASTFHQRSPDLRLMVDAASLCGDERVLDIGTGTGHTAVAFAPRVAEVVGIDLTPAESVALSLTARASLRTRSEARSTEQDETAE